MHQPQSNDAQKRQKRTIRHYNNHHYQFAQEEFLSVGVRNKLMDLDVSVLMASLIVLKRERKEQ